MKILTSSRPNVAKRKVALHVRTFQWKYRIMPRLLISQSKYIPVRHRFKVSKHFLVIKFFARNIPFIFKRGIITFLGTKVRS